MSTIFREPGPVVEKAPDIDTKSEASVEESPDEYRPVEGEQDILEALGVEENVRYLPQEDRNDLQELSSYLESYMGEVGLPRTLRGVKRAIGSLKKEFGLDEEADPQSIIKRIGGIAKSWKEISFIRDFEERKKVLVKLLSTSSPKEMNRVILEELEKRKVWQ